MDRLLLLCVIYLMQVAVCFSSEEKSQEFHQGRFTRDIPTDKSTIVYPRKVDHTGEFVSHLIPHHYKRSYYYAKRHSGLGNYSLEDQVHYRIPIDGEEHHLELEPNHGLLAPGSVIESRGDFDDVRIKRAKDSQCLYHGKVRGHDSSRTAISTCYGLAGFVRTKRGYYIIEPVRDHDHATGKEHAHVMYKMDPDEILEPNCRSKGLIHSLAERALREAKLKRALQSKGSQAKDINANLYVETLVVMDKPFLDFHKSFDVENYALTVMNMVYNIYSDASFGAEAEITIVRMIRLEKEDDEMNLGVNKDAETTLTNFCDWQKKMNPGDDSHPNHHDVAVLLTRVDICYDNTECGLLGLAKMGGTCDPKIACAINEDNGLILGYTVAHEMGHTLGLEHDEPPDTPCTGFMSDGKWHTVMNPSINSFTGEWSTCSESYFKIFIDSGFGACLLDKPSDHDFKIIDILPGVMYGATYQCKELISKESFVCEMGITCDSLNCRTADSECYETHEPPVPGTSCGEKKWCYKSKCLTIGERPGAVDGGWSAWGPWSACSRTCGAGVTSTERKCNKPKPAHGGKYCIGERKRHKICSTEPCAVGQPSFRDVQCAEFNDWTYPETKKKHKWTGIFLPGDNPCALACVNEDKTVTTLKPQVIDGTTCHRGLRDICIGGACREIPCDLDLESKAVEDVCGVCHGDGKGCTVKRGSESFKMDKKKLQKLVDVPVGSRNIRVQEVEPSKAHIVVKEGKKVLINGNKLGMFQVPGSKAWLGMTHVSQEALNIPGPVTAALVIEMRCLENVKVEWSIATKKGKERRGGDSSASYSWEWIDWSECSAQCGPGLEISIPKCVEKEAGLVEDLYCHDKEKPDDKERPCYLEPCAPRWMIGDWSECDNGKRSRIVKCVKPAGEGEGESDIIDDSECKGTKPVSEDECTGGNKSTSDTTGGQNCPMMNRQVHVREQIPLIPPNRNHPESLNWNQNLRFPEARGRLTRDKNDAPLSVKEVSGNTFWEQHIMPEQLDSDNSFWKQHISDTPLADKDTGLWEQNVQLDREYQKSLSWPLLNSEVDGNYKAQITLQKRSVEHSRPGSKPNNVADTRMADFLFSPDVLKQKKSLEQKNSEENSSVKERSIKQGAMYSNPNMKRSVEMRNRGHQSTEFLDNELSVQEYLDASKLDLRNSESEFVGASGETALDKEAESNVRVSRFAERQESPVQKKVHRRSPVYLGSDLTEYEEGPKILEKGTVQLLDKSDNSVAKVTKGRSTGIEAQDESNVNFLNSLPEINGLYKRSLLQRRYLYTDKDKSPYDSKNVKFNNEKQNHLCKTNLHNEPSLDKVYNSEMADVDDASSVMLSTDAKENERPLSLLDLEMEREVEEKLKKRFAASCQSSSSSAGGAGSQQNSLLIDMQRESGVVPPRLMDPMNGANSRRRRSTKHTENTAKQFLSAQFYDSDVMPIVSVNEDGKLLEESDSFNDKDDIIDEDEEFEDEERRAKRENLNARYLLDKREQTRSVNSGRSPTSIATKKLELMIPIEVDLLSSDASHSPRLLSRSRGSNAATLQSISVDRRYKQAFDKAPSEDEQYHNKRNSFDDNHKFSHREYKSNLGYPDQMPDAMEQTSNDQRNYELNSNDAPYGMDDENQNQEEEAYENNDDDLLSVPALTDEEKTALMESVIRKRVDNGYMEPSEAEIDQNAEYRADMQPMKLESSNQKRVYNVYLEPGEGEPLINQNGEYNAETQLRDTEPSIDQKPVYNAEMEPKDAESSINQKSVYMSDMEPRDSESSIQQKRVYNAYMEPRDYETSINQKRVSNVVMEPRDTESSIHQQRVYNAEIEPMHADASVHQKRENIVELVPSQSHPLLIQNTPGNAAPASAVLTTYDMNKIVARNLQTPLEAWKKVQWQPPAHPKNSLVDGDASRSSRLAVQSPTNQGYINNAVNPSNNLQMVSNTRPEKRVVKSADNSQATEESKISLKRHWDTNRRFTGSAASPKDRKRLAIFERDCSNNSLQSEPKDDKPKKTSRGSTVIDRIHPENLHYTVVNESVDEETGEQNNTNTNLDGKQAELEIQKLQEVGHQVQAPSSPDGG